jgi:hypothetical protein
MLAWRRSRPIVPGLKAAGDRWNQRPDTGRDMLWSPLHLARMVRPVGRAQPFRDDPSRLLQRKHQPTRNISPRFDTDPGGQTSDMAILRRIAYLANRLRRA